VEKLASSETSSIKLNEVIPLGRSGNEYLQMFNLFGMHENRSFLDCAAGPSSFNAFMTTQGKRVVSVDPLFAKEKKEIEANIDVSFDNLIKQVIQSQDMFQWDKYKSVDDLVASRRYAMNEFLKDFDQGKAEGRYMNAQLPYLDFADNSFEIALCSHFLFLYSSLFSLEFHVRSILEMVRVAKECRIFPLFDLTGKTSPLLKDVVKQLRDLEFHTQIINVPYEFQKGANQCLIVRKTINNI
jgi:hypothetical protein